MRIFRKRRRTAYRPLRRRFKRYGRSLRKPRTRRLGAQRRVFRRGKRVINRNLTRMSASAQGFVRVPRLIQPASMSVRLPYFNNGSLVLQAAAATYIEFLWNLSSPEAPDITGTGHQARGFDQWSQMYSSYIVTGVSYMVKIRPGGTSGLTARLCTPDFYTGSIVAPASLASGIFNDITDVFESPNNRYVKARQFYGGLSENTANSINVMSTDVPGNKRALMYRGKIEPRACLKYWNAINQTGSAALNWPDDFMSSTSTTPTRSIQLGIFMASKPGATGGSGAFELLQLPSTAYDVKIVYDVLFQTPVYPSAS